MCRCLPELMRVFAPYVRRAIQDVHRDRKDVSLAYAAGKRDISFLPLAMNRSKVQYRTESHSARHRLYQHKAFPAAQRRLA